MGRKLQDMAGQQFSRLLVLRFVGRRAHSSVWACRCDCGAEVEVSRTQLLNETTKSCGCFRRDRMAATKTHGERAEDVRHQTSPEYKAWDSMKQRCGNANDKAWPWYGGRGITVCDAWQHDFPAFLQHIGRRPSAKHSIDRIDGDKGYEPGNLRWATWTEQARNRSNARREFFQGAYRPLVEIAELAGIPYPLFKSRVTKGWDIDRAAKTPINLAKSHPRGDHCRP